MNLASNLSTRWHLACVGLFKQSYCVLIKSAPLKTEQHTPVLHCCDAIFVVVKCISIDFYVVNFSFPAFLVLTPFSSLHRLRALILTLIIVFCAWLLFVNSVSHLMKLSSVLLLLSFFAAAMLAKATDTWTADFRLSNSTAMVTQVDLSAAVVLDSAQIQIASDQAIIMRLPMAFQSVNANLGSVNCKLSNSTRSYSYPTDKYYPAVGMTMEIESATVYAVGVTVNSALTLPAGTPLYVICRLNLPASGDYSLSVSAGNGPNYNGVYLSAASTVTVTDSLLEIPAAAYSMVFSMTTGTTWTLYYAVNGFFATIADSDDRLYLRSVGISSAVFYDATKSGYPSSASTLTVTMQLIPSDDHTQAQVITYLESNAMLNNLYDVMALLNLQLDEVSVSATEVPGQCYDGKIDNLETDVDCGGGQCIACAQDKTCATGSDCWTALCSSKDRCTNAAAAVSGATAVVIAALVAVLATLAF